MMTNEEHLDKAAEERIDRVLTEGGVRADDDLASADAPGDIDPDSLHPRHPVRRQSELLDEGVEETFPASDPVSVKRIT